MNTFDKVIGKGSFSTAYLQSDKKTVVLKSVDYVKEFKSYDRFFRGVFSRGQNKLKNKIIWKH